MCFKISSNIFIIRHYTWPADTTYDLLSTDITLDPLLTLHLTDWHDIWPSLYRHYTWPADTTYVLLSTDTTLDLFSTDTTLHLMYSPQTLRLTCRHYIWPTLCRQYVLYIFYRHYAWPADTTFDLLSADNMLGLPSTDTTLDLLVIHIGCSLVQHQYVVLPKDCSGQTDQLPLSHTQVLSALRHLHVQTLSLTLNL